MGATNWCARILCVNDKEVEGTTNIPIMAPFGLKNANSLLREGTVADWRDVSGSASVTDSRRTDHRVEVDSTVHVTATDE